MVDNYIKIVDAIKKEVLSFIEAFEDEIFIMGNDFMRFRFKTDDNLVNILFQSV